MNVCHTIEEWHFFTYSVTKGIRCRYLGTYVPNPSSDTRKSTRQKFVSL